MLGMASTACVSGLIKFFVCTCQARPPKGYGTTLLTHAPYNEKRPAHSKHARARALVEWHPMRRCLS